MKLLSFICLLRTVMIVDRLADVRIDVFLHPIGRSYLDAYAGEIRMEAKVKLIWFSGIAILSLLFHSLVFRLRIFEAWC